MRMFELRVLSGLAACLAIALSTSGAAENAAKVSEPAVSVPQSPSPLKPVKPDRKPEKAIEAPERAPAASPASGEPKTASDEVEKADGSNVAKGGYDREKGYDYYGERADGILKNEQGKPVAPHPLAAANPDKFVVVCEAGCRSRKPQIVFSQPKSSIVSISEMKPTSGGGDAAKSDDNAIVCLAGCGTRRSVKPDQQATIGEWKTTVARMPDSLEASVAKPRAKKRAYHRRNILSLRPKNWTIRAYRAR
jgi:hypothetical protein